MRMLIVMFVLLVLPTAAFADACPFGYAQLEDQMIEVIGSDCVEAIYQGVEWGGCSEDPLLWVTNNCEVPVLLTSISGAECDAATPCDRLEPGERGVVRLPAPDVGAVQTVELDLSTEETEPQSVQVTATYGAAEVENSGTGGGICSTVRPNSPAPTSALMLIAAGCVLLGRRRR